MVSSRTKTPMGIRPPLRFLAIAAIGIGCTSAPATSPDDPAPVYSYGEIAGAWEGTVKEDRRPGEYTMAMTLSASASKGAAAGQIRYNVSEVGSLDDCTGSLIANAPPEGNLYKFRETIIGQCVPNGQVELIHNRTEDTIGFSWYSQAGVRCCTATLRRKS